jgi:hypothetical protein
MDRPMKAVPTHSASFTAKYRGQCNNPDCHKRGNIEQGDCCEYLGGYLMHLRCSRAMQRAICEEIHGELCHGHNHMEVPA